MNLRRLHRHLGRLHPDIGGVQIDLSRSHADRRGFHIDRRSLNIDPARGHIDRLGMDSDGRAAWVANMPRDTMPCARSSARTAPMARNVEYMLLRAIAVGMPWVTRMRRTAVLEARLSCSWMILGAGRARCSQNGDNRQ